MSGFWSAMFQPKSIGIVGASDDPTKPGAQLLRYLGNWGYSGEILPVNPSRSTVGGRTCYDSVEALPHPVDLVIVAVPAPFVLAALQSAARAGTGAAIVFSAGFSELNSEGREIERQMRELAGATGMRILGPNCLGAISVVDRTCASWSPTLGTARLLLPGDVVVITQSGAIGAAAGALLARHGVGISHWISTGNEADLTFAELIEASIAVGARAVFGYMESIKEPDRLREALRTAADAQVPVFIVKGGMTERGALASATHTGSLINNAEAQAVFLRQAGAVVGSSVEDMCAALALTMSMDTPTSDGGLVVATNSGGYGVLIADQAHVAGLHLPMLNVEQQAVLRGYLYDYLATENPVDFSTAHIADPGSVAEIVRRVDRASPGPARPIFLVALVSGRQDAGWDTVKIISELGVLKAESRANIVILAIACDESVGSEARRWGLPVFESAAQALRAVSCLPRTGLVASGREPSQLRPPPGQAAPAATQTLTEVEAKAALRRAGLPVVDGIASSDPATLLRAASDLGYPVVLKIAGGDVTHKTEVGGVRLGIATPVELEQAITELWAASAVPGDVTGRQLLVEKMVHGSVELIIGMSRDPLLGPIVLVGSGGVQAELLKDVAIRVAPVTTAQALGMLAELRLSELITGFRGSPAADVDKLAELIVAVSDVALARPSIQTIDLNPVIASGHSATIVDALIDVAAGGSVEA